MRRGFVHLAFGLASLLTANATSIQAKDYPERPVRVIVPYPAGGAVDVIARIITQKLSDELGDRFYVENLPGATGASGTVTAAAAKPDGYTILFVSPDFVTTPILKAKAPYDPFTSFAPLTLATASQDVIAVHESLPAKSMNELMALLAANPGQYTYATPGYGSLPHLKGELLFKLSHKLDVTHVPFQGFGPAVTSTIAGHTSMVLGIPITLVASHIEKGALRALAVEGNQRSPALPTVPTLQESGFSPLGSPGWFGVLAPAGTPNDIIDLLHRQIARIMSLPDVKQNLTTNGLDIVASTPEEFASWIKSETAHWRKVVRETGLNKLSW
jgi:tripartite-type tricarboxylate transporter receptor subunit TctC